MTGTDEYVHATTTTIERCTDRRLPISLPMKTQDQYLLELLRRVSTKEEAAALWLICGAVLFSAAYYNA